MMAGGEWSIRIFEDTQLPGLEVPLSNLTPDTGDSNAQASSLIISNSSPTLGCASNPSSFSPSIAHTIPTVPLPNNVPVISIHHQIWI